MVSCSEQQSVSRKPSRASLGAGLKQRTTASRVAKTRKLGRTCRTSSSMLPNRPVGGHTGWEDTRPMQVVFLNEVEPEKLGACGCRWTEEPASSVVRGAACQDPFEVFAKAAPSFRTEVSEIPVPVTDALPPAGL